ncbi:hypothetical protein SDC9_173669 [bioreactor metagenome]|uniref:Uncharacterized protein n=1 Tax=bioreactor metagenome TaxID=1076179 RepID=A0A645GHS9_9ZZZZ
MVVRGKNRRGHGGAEQPKNQEQQNNDIRTGIPIAVGIIERGFYPAVKFQCRLLCLRRVGVFIRQLVFNIVESLGVETSHLVGACDFRIVKGAENPAEGRLNWRYFFFINRGRHFFLISI